jgi:hypothetical protein
MGLFHSYFICLDRGVKQALGCGARKASGGFWRFFISLE